MSSSYPAIVLTTGEPAGIGPDLALMLAATVPVHDFGLAIIADGDMLSQRAAMLGLPYNLPVWHTGMCGAGLIHQRSASPVQAGRLNARNAPYTLSMLDRAIQGCLDGEFSAMVTAPIHKAIINEAGIRFSGHTEYLANFCRVDHVVMMLAANTLRVALATTHLPLREVADQITYESLSTTIRILHDALKRQFCISNPHIAICGLNPHSGEDGHLGREEIEIIAPVINDMRSQGISLSGPMPADSLFTTSALADVDAVLAMYHDQGLPVLKHVGFGHAVNITLGLPIIRTSVDHGTALSLAGSGQADLGSLKAALELALRLAVSSDKARD